MNLKDAELSVTLSIDIMEGKGKIKIAQVFCITTDCVKTFGIAKVLNCQKYFLNSDVNSTVHEI